MYTRRKSRDVLALPTVPSWHFEVEVPVSNLLPLLVLISLGNTDSLSSVHHRHADLRAHAETMPFDFRKPTLTLETVVVGKVTILQ